MSSSKEGLAGGRIWVSSVSIIPISSNLSAAKNDQKEITNFNISVGVTEEFMRSAEQGLDYDLIDPSTKSIKGKLNAAEVFDKIIASAWQDGRAGHHLFGQAQSR